MLDVRDRLVEELADVLVVQLVLDAAPVAPPDDEPEMTQDAQLMGHRRRLHPDVLGELGHRAGPDPQATEDSHAARGRERLHRLSHNARERRIESVSVDEAAAVRHQPIIPAHPFRRSGLVGCVGWARLAAEPLTETVAAGTEHVTPDGRGVLLR